MEKPNTTSLSNDCIQDTKSIKKNPHRYIEINIIRKDRTIDNFFILGSKQSFKYDKKKYNIDSECIYIVPLKNGSIMPTCFFNEKNEKPKLFKKTNKGITGKALSLLYNEKLYVQLFYPDIGKYNFFIIVLSIGLFITYGIGVYLLYTWWQNGGV